MPTIGSPRRLIRSSRTIPASILASVSAGLVGLSLLGLAPAYAQMRKCVDADGNLTLTDKQCPTGSRGQTVYVNPNILDTSGLREQARRSDHQRAAERLAEQEMEEERAAARHAGQRNRNADLATTYGCRQARANYDTAKSVRTGPTAGKDRPEERLRMNAECGTSEQAPPPQFRREPMPQARPPTETLVRCDAKGCYGTLGTFFHRKTCDAMGCRGPDGTVVR